MSEEQLSPADPSVCPSAATAAEIASSPQSTVLAGFFIASEPGPVPNEALGWPHAVLTVLLTLIGCATMLILVLFARVPVQTAIACALLLIGGIVVLIPSGRSISLLRRVGYGLSSLVNGLVHPGGSQR